MSSKHSKNALKLLHRFFKFRLSLVVLGCPKLSQVVLGCVIYHEPAKGPIKTDRNPEIVLD